jgi:hypothetical protein
MTSLSAFGVTRNVGEFHGAEHVHRTSISVMSFRLVGISARQLFPMRLEATATFIILGRAICVLPRIIEYPASRDSQYSVMKTSGTHLNSTANCHVDRQRAKTRHFDVRHSSTMRNVGGRKCLGQHQQGMPAGITDGYPCLPCAPPSQARVRYMPVQMKEEKKKAHRHRT